jgi:opacity protein-like surface antigen
MTCTDPLPSAPRRRASHHLVLAAVALALATSAQAQGSVGTQGFGYPTAQLSTRARGTAGAVAPFDAESPLNPAALTSTGQSIVHAQYEPEFRTVRVGGATERNTLSRFPLILAALPVGSRSTLGLSASSYLDRTFATSVSGPRVIADTTIDARQTRRSVGGVTDVRLAAARALNPRLSIGVGVHGYTGENRVTVRFADDSARFISFSDSVRLSYGGVAASAGLSWRPASHIAVAGSYRRGGTLRVRDDAIDQQLGSGRIPDHVTGGVMYDGIAGTTLAASVGWQQWSAMNGAGSAGTGARDAIDVALGADATGPRFGRGAVALRAGAAWRELPFPVPGSGEASEFSLAVGAGVPLAFNRASLDLGAQRARRSAGAARETGWMFSIGLTVRP